MNLNDQFILPDWPVPKQVHAIQTTRMGGVSTPPYDSLNLAEHVGDDPMMVNRNRILLKGILPSEPVWLNQVHGATVVNADDNSCHAEADACITRESDRVCVVMTADCLPILLCDEKGSVVGAVHAGWKGLAAGVIEATIRSMEVRPQGLYAWLGPAISQQVFEVGDEVRMKFILSDQNAEHAFISGKQGKWFADLYMLARVRLINNGVTRIFGGGFCTYQDKKRFYSYRRDGVTGRMGTFIWLELR